MIFSESLGSPKENKQKRATFSFRLFKLNFYLENLLFRLYVASVGSAETLAWKVVAASGCWIVIDVLLSASPSRIR